MEHTKRLLSALLFSLLISFGLTNCKDSKNEHPDDPKPKTVKKPDEIIDIEVAKVQYDTYEKRRVDLIQKYEDSVDGYSNNDKIRQDQNDQGQADPNDPNGNRFDVARYVSWDYETIKKYLKYIEQESKAANVEISTLRFYFSNYPEDGATGVRQRQNSIMITPTLRENDREYIFEIDESDPENLKPLLLSDAFGDLKNQEKGMGNIYEDSQRSHASFASNLIKPSSTVLPYYQGKSVTMNRGSGAPPPYHEE